jgi:outer membrane receptor protein involved in Fe transport
LLDGREPPNNAGGLRGAFVVGAWLWIGSGVIAAEPAVVPEAVPATAPVAAPVTLRVEGRVVDASGRPVPGAAVSIEGATRTITTDARGRFVIDGAALGASIVVLKDGFGAGLGSVVVGALDDIVLLSETQVTETITVEGEPPPATQGSARLSREELQRLPGAGNDVVRTLSAMPGVASFPLPLGSSGVVIRGSSPQDSKVLIDDFVVPSLYHDIGFRSIVPSEAIDALEYVPGGFDVAYGRAASGIVHLTTRAGSEEHSQQAEGGASELGVLAQGGTKRGRYMIAFRRSTVDLLLPALLPDDLDLSLTTVPRYYDEQFRFDYRLSTKCNVRVSSLGSDDALELYASKDENADKRFANRTRFVRLTTAARYHDGPWSANLAVSGMALQSTFERGLYQHLDVTSPSITTRGELVRTEATAAGLADVQVRLGGENVVTRHHVDLALPSDRREGEPIQPDDPMDTTNRFDGIVTTTNLATWAAIAANLDRRIRFTGGIRVDAYRRTRDTVVQPRGELQVKLRPKLVLRLSAGGYSRPPEHQTELLETQLRAERSTQLIAGVTYEPAEGTRLQGSVYWTDRRRLITRDEMGTLSNDGRGTTSGAELLATLRAGPWLGWLAYAYSHSTRVDAPGADRRLFDYDQPHNLNVAASYRIGRWQLGARFRASSGLPMTPVELGVFDSDANLHYPVFGEVNSERAPLHHQLDLRFDKSWKWGSVKMTKFLDIQNVYLNDSVVTYFYGFDYTQRAAFRSLPILPSAGLKGEF